MPRRAKLWTTLGSTAAIAVVLARVYPHRYLGYDGAWSALWGRELAHGHSPTYEAPFAPTPHPLENVVSTLVSLAGRDPYTVLPWLTLAAFALAIILVTLAGQRRFGLLAGVVAGALLASRPSLVAEMQYGSADVWFVALVAGAFVADTGSRRARPVLVLLALAGLLRPEAWVLSAAYVLYACLGRPARAWLVPILLAVSAPVLWGMSDLVITGDALYSLHGTSAFAAQLGRPRSEDAALRGIPGFLRDLLGDRTAALGVLGALAGALLMPRRSQILLGAGLLGLAGFVLLGLVDLPVIDRYLLVPALVLTIFAGATAGGWVRLRGSPVRTAWVLGGLAALAWLATGTSGDATRLRDVTAHSQRRGRVQADLVAELSDARVRSTARSCPAVYVPDFRTRPLVARMLDVSPRDVHVGTLRREGVGVSYASVAAFLAFGVPDSHPPIAPRPAPHARRIAHTASWQVDVRCVR